MWRNNRGTTVGRAGAALAAAAVLVAGCGGGGDPVSTGTIPKTTTTAKGAATTASPRTTRVTVPPASTVPQPTSATTAAGADFGPAEFRSPTGNIFCQMSAAFAACEIVEHTYTPPPKPSDCDLDFGDSIAVEGTDPAAFSCHGDTLQGDFPTLDHGSRARRGPFLCDSEVTGVTCSNIVTGHGFLISRAKFSLS